MATLRSTTRFGRVTWRWLSTCCRRARAILSGQTLRCALTARHGTSARAFLNRIADCRLPQPPAASPHVSRLCAKSAVHGSDCPRRSAAQVTDVIVRADTEQVRQEQRAREDQTFHSDGRQPRPVCAAAPPSLRCSPFSARCLRGCRYRGLPPGVVRQAQPTGRPAIPHWYCGRFGEDGRTPLHIAAAEGHENLVKCARGQPQL